LGRRNCGADHHHLESAWRRQVGLVGQAVLHGPVGHEALQVAHRHRLALGRPHAHLLALRFLRAHPPAHGRQGVRPLEHLKGRGKVALGDLGDELGNVHLHRAALDALSVLALEAALGLADGRRFRQAKVDLLEVARPLGRVLLGHAHALDGHPLLCRQWFGIGGGRHRIGFLAGPQQCLNSGHAHLPAHLRQAGGR